MTANVNRVVTTEMVPVLAESWELVEPTRLRLSLRQGVTFHNGEAWHAEAAKASFDILFNQELVASLSKFIDLAGISAFEVVDDYTVDVVTPAPKSETLGLTLRIGFVALPPNFLQEKGIEAFNETPIGTGPYKFESWSRGQDLVFTRNESYWDPNGPTIPTIRYISRSETSVRVQTVAAGKADFACNIGVQTVTIERMRRNLLISS